MVNPTRLVAKSRIYKRVVPPVQLQDVRWGIDGKFELALMLSRGSSNPTSVPETRPALRPHPKPPSSPTQRLTQQTAILGGRKQIDDEREYGRPRNLNSQEMTIGEGRLH